MDETLQKLKEYLNAPKAGVVNPERYEDVMASCAIIRDIILFNDPEATIEVSEGALQLGSMAIRVVTSDVTVYDTVAFAEATKNADNFQIYPTADDRVKLDILFDGVIEYTLM
jgi:hypothetical protein